MQDTPITVTVHREDREPLNNRPRSQELIISDLFGDLLIKFDEEGSMTLRHVGTRDVVFLHLTADLATALSTAHLTWIQQIEAWQEVQQTKKEIAAWQHAVDKAKAMTAEAADPTQEQPRCPEHNVPLRYIDDPKPWYLCRHDHVVTPEELAEQATREAKEEAVARLYGSGVSLDQEETCDMGNCINPRKPGYYVCQEHWEAEQREAAENAEQEANAMAEAAWETYMDEQAAKHEEQLDAEELAREAAEQVVDLDPQRCVAVGCKEPALLRIGEFWYCAEHSKEPIPF